MNEREDPMSEKEFHLFQEDSKKIILEMLRELETNHLMDIFEYLYREINYSVGYDTAEINLEENRWNDIINKIIESRLSIEKGQES